MSDTLVFDIETQNFFTSPEVGWDNFGALKISVVGVYSYENDRYSCFEENEMPALVELFHRARLVVGFSSNRYDVPVLNHYFQRLGESSRLNLWHKERIDLLEEIEMASGIRVSLNKLAEANLGFGKSGHGSEAIALYAEGKMDELKTYCLKDVEITKKLFDLYRERGYLFVPDRQNAGEVTKVNLGRRIAAANATLF